MALSEKTVNNGPIPGENFTSDTRNYPWHQPPEFSDINKALDMLGEKLTVFKTANALMTFVEMGVPLTRVADTVITAGISEGKWTPDFALLLAGPTTRMLELICQGFDIEYTIGIEEDEDDFVTATFFKEEKKLKEGDGSFDLLNEELGSIKEDASKQEGKEADIQDSGFMAMSGGAPSEASTGEEVTE